jgi:diguanylate cyclase (GGDEF)-like protein/PAS domain S-box-containing protein
MPKRRAARAAARARPLPMPRPREGRAAAAPSASSHDTDPPVVCVPPELLTWAERDDGCMVLLDSSGGEPRVRWVNRGGAQMLGYVPVELVGETLTRLLRSPFAAAHPACPQDAPVLDPCRTVRRSVRVQRRDGSPLRVALTSVPVGTAGHPRWIVRLVVQPDVEQVAGDLRRSHERFRALADRAPVAIFSSESGLRLAYVNDRFCELYGESADRLAGTGWLDQVHPQDRESVIDAVTRVLAGAPQELPLRVLRRDGERRSVLARIVPVPQSKWDCGFVGTLEDVTERQAWEASLAHQASHDPLTGLLNRRRLLDLLRQDLAAVADPHADGGRPALLFLDLDDFKLVNDSLGHDLGDRLLVEVATRLGTAVRDGDVVARLGGDEFVVLCREVADERAAGEMARRVLDAVTGPVSLGASTVTVSVSASIGVVVAGPAHVEAEELLRDADVAMYQAKAAGRNCWALFDEQARWLAQQRLDLAWDLRLALDAGDLTVHYQPIVRLFDSPTGGPLLASVEALARWRHPTEGMIPPVEFVELAERHGLVALLGLQVLRSACRQMVQWRDRLGTLAPGSVSVNVSALQLRQLDFPETVGQVLQETGLPGSALCLELTETVVMQDAAAAAVSFRRLHALGVRVAIDDFGTGYSSLALLRELPFSQLKIDRSLLPDLGEQRPDPVVAAVVALGRALHLDVVAEGVETPAQAAELRRLGCQLAQGLLFSAALPPDALEEWVLAQVALSGVEAS